MTFQGQSFICLIYIKTYGKIYTHIKRLLLKIK